MRVIVRSAAAREASTHEACDHDVPRLLRPETSRWDDLSSNLVALVAAFAKPAGSTSRPFFAMFAQPRWDPRDSMTASVMVHAAAVLLLLNLTSLWMFVAPDAPKPRFEKQHLEWYNMTTQLPAISPADSDAKPQERGGKVKQASQKGATVLHPQTVVSNPVNPDNSEQTIFQPDAPSVRLSKQALPNVVIWNDTAKPAPPVDLVNRQLNAIRMPTDLVHRRAVEEPPLAKLEVQVPVAKLAMPDAPAPDVPLPPPPDTAVGANTDADARLKKLVVMNANPAPPKGPLDVAEGNRSGAFSAAPIAKSGTPNAAAASANAGAAAGPAPAGDGSLGGKRELAGIRVPGLSVSGANGPVNGPVVSGPASVPAASLPSAPGAPAAGLPSMPSRAGIVPRNSLPYLNAPKSELGFTPGKRVYTVQINMPNLSSSGGGSWVLRFAELEMRPFGDQIEISAPVAERKIDPGYSQDAARDKVEGVLKLHAIIRRDGRVERVEVLHSLDARLDQRAIDALLRWQFHPSLRKGQPVDLEAVIEIPFKLPVVVK